MSKETKLTLHKTNKFVDSILLLGNLLVWGLVYFGLKGELKLGAMSQVRIELITTPKTVQLKSWHVGGDLDHGYITTPKLLYLDAKTQKITVSRPGYVEQNIPLNPDQASDPSQAIKSELPPLAQQKYSLRIEKVEDFNDDQNTPSQGMDGLKVRVDGGLYFGPVPLEAHDLVAGSHTIEFFFESKSQPTPPCYFQIGDAGKTNLNQHLVTIGRPQGKKNYVIKGCVIRK